LGGERERDRERERERKMENINPPFLPLKSWVAEDHPLPCLLLPSQKKSIGKFFVTLGRRLST
jgi:hypothetical protein